MAKFVCSVCGYVSENGAPDFCPQCKAPKEKFKEVAQSAGFACEHEVGVSLFGRVFADHGALHHLLHQGLVCITPILFDRHEGFPYPREALFSHFLLINTLYLHMFYVE